MIDVPSLSRSPPPLLKQFRPTRCQLLNDTPTPSFLCLSRSAQRVICFFVARITACSGVWRFDIKLLSVLQAMSRFCCYFSGAGSTERKKSKVSSEGSGGSARPSSLLEAGQESRSKPSSKDPSPILVEHFTSQGCSSCPSSDLFMSKLGQKCSVKGSEDAEEVSGTPPVIVLAYHVDYWDYLGWKDPFANHRWSSRQRNYGEALQQDSIYTPEVVVQGRSHCIGSNEDAVYSLLREAPQFPSLDLRVSFKRPSPMDLEVSLTISSKLKVDGNLDVLVALFENGQVTDCIKGENRGRILTNDFIVRSLEKGCTIHSGHSRKVNGLAIMKLWDGYSKTKSGMAVFLQSPLSMEVYGAQIVDLPDDS
ncbi:hypothetical protein KP509_09G053500 [Ceratopteris richardii]|uniref:DUF1223 domain-containing protein n=1 Tax=Ceratopteris richardii TaxID=49495 RepID=A0A8T2UAI3_CERRI|nr:hypothetical protein KP509_09G053500 [Ceratopteris richardii]